MDEIGNATISRGSLKYFLRVSELELIADALDVISPDTEKQRRLASNLAYTFRVLAEMKTEKPAIV